ncbi:hypothetical protein IAT38_007110 [Cryptococcus sp. DSM 104549]
MAQKPPPPLPAGTPGSAADELSPLPAPHPTLAQSVSMRDYMTHYRLPDINDRSEQATPTQIPSEAIRRWQVEEVRFAFNERAIADLGDRLSHLQLDNPVLPHMMAAPMVLRAPVLAEPGVRQQLMQMRMAVEEIVNGCMGPGVEPAEWMEVMGGPSGRPGAQVQTERNGQWGFRGHLVEQKRPYHLKRHLKPLLRALRDGVAVTLHRREGETWVTFSEQVPYITSEDDKKELSGLLTQLVQQLETRSASRVLLTDALRWTLVSRRAETSNPDLSKPPIWNLSFSDLLGNSGPLKLDDAPHLRTLAREPGRLTDLPLGAWCVLTIFTSFPNASPSPPAPIEWSPPPRKKRVPKPTVFYPKSTRKRAYGAGVRAPSRTGGAGRSGAGCDAVDVHGGGRGGYQLQELKVVTDTPNLTANGPHCRVFALPLSSGVVNGPFPSAKEIPLPPLFRSASPFAGSSSPALGSHGAVLTLGQGRAQGRLWDVFEATVTTTATLHTSSLHHLVPFAGLRTLAKLASPMLFPFGWMPEETYTMEQARYAIKHEQRVMDRLRSLQGSVVPVWGGLWGGTLMAGEEGGAQAVWELWVAVVEDCGRAVDMNCLSENDKYAIVHHYRVIHRAGIIHNDVTARHWLRHPSDGIRIVDFDSAVIVDELDPEEWARGGYDPWDERYGKSSVDESCEDDGASMGAESTAMERYRAARAEREMRRVLDMLGMDQVSV